MCFIYNKKHLLNSLIKKNSHDEKKKLSREIPISKNKHKYLYISWFKYVYFNSEAWTVNHQYPVKRFWQTSV